jgi:hypothetical protein
MPVVTDVVAGYGYATDRDAPDPIEVLRSAAERIELIIPNVIPGIVDLLLAKAARGLSRGAIIEDPDGLVEPLLGIDGIEIHASARGENYRLYRADEQEGVHADLVDERLGALGVAPPGNGQRGLFGRGLRDVWLAQGAGRTEGIRIGVWSSRGSSRRRATTPMRSCTSRIAPRGIRISRHSGCRSPVPG